MFNLEGFIPKLCQLAQEAGDNEQALLLRSAGLQALSYMVLFFGPLFLQYLLMYSCKFIISRTSLSSFYKYEQESIYFDDF